MRVLLLGELSGVHRELAGGLRRRGHEVVAAHAGDTYRRFAADLSFPQVTADPRASPAQFAHQLAAQLAIVPRFTGFDVVQLMTPKFFYWRAQLPVLQLLKRLNRAVVMVNVSCSHGFNRLMLEQHRSPCAECKQFDLGPRGCHWESADERLFEERVYREVDGLFATHRSYHEPLRRLGLSAPLFEVALPVDLEGVSVRPPREEGRLRVYYGETRHGYKGGLHITGALELIGGEPEFEQVRSSRLPFSDYMAMLDDVDVLIDQANVDGMGMNALYAMARGKVALTGAEPLEMRFLGATPSEVPAVGISPDAPQIAAALRTLAADRHATRRRGLASRRFIEQFHSADVVAARFEAAWNVILTAKRDRASSPALHP